MSFPATDFDALAIATLPSFFDQFGVPALHAHEGGEGVAVRIIPGQSLEVLGEYDERAGAVHTIEVYASDEAVIGDTWTTDDGAIWRADAVLNDDGLMRKFAVYKLGDAE